MMHNTFRRRVFFILLATVAIWFFLWYSHSLVERLNQADKQNCETIARLWAGVQYPLSIVGDGSSIMSCSVCGSPYGVATEGFESDSFFCSVCGETRFFIRTDRMLISERNNLVAYTRNLFSDLVSRLRFPTIFSDMNGYPQIVNGQVTDAFSREQIDNLRIRMRHLGRINQPVPIISSQDTIGYLYYGSSDLSQKMQLIPFLELGLLLVVAVVIYFLLRSEITREKDMSWVGFARETAHQISTPLSSLMGWLELLEEEDSLEGNSETAEAIYHMSGDVRRLVQIADRYGQMGRKPKLQPVNMEIVMAEIVNYFNARKGLLGNGVILETAGDCTDTLIMGNSVLLGWVIENMIKNAVAACAGNPDGGSITLECRESEIHRDHMEILISDNGNGIPHGNQGRVFNAGFTTRKGGWGLGLSLSRRIIEEHHKGKMRLVSSVPGQGTVFSVSLPVMTGGEDDYNTLGG